MERLSQRDLRALLGFVEDLYALRPLDEFAAHVVRALPRLVPSEITTYNEVNPRRGRFRWVGYPSDWVFRDGDAIFEQHMRDHPLINYHARSRDGRTLKISDFLSQGRFHRLGLYNEFFRRLDVEHQMAVVLPAPRPLLIGIALNRGRSDFSERDRTVLELARRHLIAAYRNAEAVSEMRFEIALLRQGVEAAAGAMVAARDDGRVVLSTPAARKRLTSYFGERALAGNRLPEALRRWVDQHRSGGRVPWETLAPREPFVVERDGRRLAVRLVSDRPLFLLLLDEQATHLQPQGLESLGLTRREAEVLAWVAEGKTAWEVSVILGLSARTVEKHLERIYAKLGVETRTAAAASALQWAALAHAPG